MKTTLCILGLLLCTITINAQDFSFRNSLMLESNLIAYTALTYDRIIPLSTKTSLLAGGGVFIGTGFGHGSQWLLAKSSLLSFGPKHFLETGVQYLYSLSKEEDQEEENESNDDESSFGLRFAYRYISNKGISLSATMNFLFNVDPVVMPALAVGYTF